jgi:hypothetical protein
MKTEEKKESLSRRDFLRISGLSAQIERYLAGVDGDLLLLADTPALAQYLTASEDASLLDQPVPFFHPEGDPRAEQASVWRHAERALAVIGARVIPGTRLAAYGHGDWNDSMQPFDPAMTFFPPQN